MKKHLMLLLALSIVATGCKKKGAPSKRSRGKTTKVAKSDDSIPLMYNYEDAELFAEGDVSILEDELLPDGSTRGIDETKVATADEVEKEIDDLINLWSEELPENKVAEYEFKTIHFDINKSDVLDDQEQILRENVETAFNAINNGKKLVVQGHCCQTGSETWNMALSQKRAKKVADQLVARGIPAESIETVAMGSECPLVWTDKEDRESLIVELRPNRRAEVVAVG